MIVSVLKKKPDIPDSPVKDELARISPSIRLSGRFPRTPAPAYEEMGERECDLPASLPVRKSCVFRTLKGDS